MKKVKTRRGITSFYIVIFVTTLLLIIAMGFLRIMVSESTRTTNNDLSNSAYDAALAGVEDAKIALIEYHKCIDQGFKADKNGTETCQQVIYYMEEGVNSESCDVVSNVLVRNGTRDENNGSEVIVRETDNHESTSDEMVQAYTCVKISEDLDDYRSSVNSNNRVRVVPIRTDDYADINMIEFSWSPQSGNVSGEHIVGLDIFQTDETFSIGELSLNSGVGTDHAELILSPSGGTGWTAISSSDVLQQSSKSDHAPISVACGNSGEFKCQARVAIPKTYRGGKRSEATFFLRVESIYGKAIDFSVKLCTGNNPSNGDGCKDNNTRRFVGVQAQIDSTGRANELFRRLDTRVELVDVNFPYPEFTFQLEGSEDPAVSKNFWVTRSCWLSNNGAASGCPNSREL